MVFLSDMEQRLGITINELEFTAKTDLIYYLYRLQGNDELKKFANMVYETKREDLIGEVNYLLSNYFHINHLDI